MSYTITDLCNGCGACIRLCPVDAIQGEKKEKHHIVEALCIDCGACGRICPEGAVKDHSGALCVMVKRSQWEKPRFNNKTCTSCNICIDACPVSCLVLSGASEKDPHGYPFLKDEKACIACGFCAEECPVDAVTME
ncbi:MAG: 4Fe-4S binding protein [Thermodesulfobacteriota bacterium]|nr:4Fe-4S binding protein [Thermodesulfobacteriota bacterium]